MKDKKYTDSCGENKKWRCDLAEHNKLRKWKAKMKRRNTDYDYNQYILLTQLSVYMQAIKSLKLNLSSPSFTMTKVV